MVFIPVADVSDAYVEQVKSIFPKLAKAGNIDNLFGRNKEEL